ncbi:MAG TPA: DNA replication/repair protein RecF [Clostridiaceae bacterium]|nr:DNA replication/repair protein RecF [Clostridiaceae bacterium]
MTIQELELIRFRNYEKESLAFGEGINILYGQNAQGKTNILEALYISSTGKSHRTNNYNDLIQRGQTGFEIKLSARLKDRENSIIIRYSHEKRKSAEINGIQRDKLSDILGTLNMILFSPETLDVVKGSPAMRRKFLDILLCQTNRKYLHLLKRYNSLVKNKSIALKKGKSEKKYEEIIPIWNEHISVYGGKIVYLRNNAINILNKYMKKEINKITNSTEDSDLVYKTFCETLEGKDEKYYEDQLLNSLNEGMQKEMNISQCIYGPHRDDFEILLNGMNSRQYCSQGQQRTLALSLILAELFYVEEIKGEKPVLLLDDVLSELDLKRQEYLLKGLSNVQTIITTTDEIPFISQDQRIVKKFYIESGKVMPKVEKKNNLE